MLRLQYVPWMLSSDGAEFIVPVGFTVPSLLLKTSNGVILRLILNSKMGSLYFKDTKMSINIKVSVTIPYLLVFSHLCVFPAC